MTTPRRRWSFSLRTFFVVMTLVACWLGYRLNWIRERHEMLSAPEEPLMMVSGPNFDWFDGPIPDRPTPFALWLFGETTFRALLVEPCADAIETENRLRRARSLFPEAEIRLLR